MKLQDFLVKAHKATYASGKEPKKNNQEADQYVYQEDKYEYIDSYFGAEYFVGIEVVKESGKVVWGMNYYGRYAANKKYNEEFPPFLKKMLSKTKAGILVRGPKSYKEKEWSYRYVYKGAFNNFTAKEVIKYKGKKIFEAVLAGGNIK
jgi:hypothetical protein